MAKWYASVGISLTIDYEDIDADTQEEAEKIAKEKAMEDIDYNNCNCEKEPIIYCCFENNKNLMEEE